MKYSKMQAIDAIRQHPELAAQMALTPTELEILKSSKVIKSSELESRFTTKSNASRFMRSLIEKGYFKRVKCGVFERLS